MRGAVRRTSLFSNYAKPIVATLSEHQPSMAVHPISLRIGLPLVKYSSSRPPAVNVGLAVLLDIEAWDCMVAPAANYSRRGLDS